MNLSKDDLTAIRQIVQEQTNDIRLNIVEICQDVKLLKEVQGQQAMHLKAIRTDVGILKQTVRRLSLQYEDLNERFKLAHI